MRMGINVLKMEVGGVLITSQCSSDEISKCRCALILKCYTQVTDYIGLGKLSGEWVYIK